MSSSVFKLYFLSPLFWQKFKTLLGQQIDAHQPTCTYTYGSHWKRTQKQFPRVFLTSQILEPKQAAATVAEAAAAAYLE